MTLLDALAAALRDCLLSGHSASLPGVGLLQRERVTARVERQPDGSSLLLPPSETVAFVPGPGTEDDTLATRILRSLGTPNADPSTTLKQAIDQLEGHLSASGSVLLPGVGTMRRGGEGLVFEADPSLLAAVAQPYEGMTPVSAQASEAPAPTDASFIDEDTLDDDLDDVLAAPLDTPDPGALRAVLPLTPEPLAEPPSPEPSSTAPEQDVPAAPPPPASPPPDVPSDDDTNLWPVAPAPTEPDPPARPDPPAPVASPAPDELATPPDEAPVDAVPVDAATDELTAPLVAAPVDSSPTPSQQEDAPATSDPSDLGWLDAYDSKEGEEAAPAAALGLAGAGAVGASAAASDDTPSHLPKPAPIIAGPVDLPPKRRVPMWAWLLIPLLALALLFFWYRSTQTPEPSEPILTAELALDDAFAPVAQDSLSASVATVPDSSELASEGLSDSTTSATPSVQEAAALEGEFPVEELTAPGASSAPPPSSPPPRPAPPRTATPATTSPSASRVPIDEPDLSGLSDADRDALIGTAPIVSGRGGFSWVVLSTRDRTPADLRARQYRDAGWRVRVFETEALGDTVYRLAIGQFASRDQADRLRPFLPSQVPQDTWRLDLSTL
ncbi:MAG: SPOR domain-containing protein [Bacteroidota bacterium]